ncbi:MAG: hypothetical protein JW934_03360 [Anaerolineae bacterium]|nr:hypothetical protein [Anaerolineae bacterium]
MRHFGTVVYAGLLLMSLAACWVPPLTLSPSPTATTEPVMAPTATPFATATPAASTATPTSQPPDHPTTRNVATNQPVIPSPTPTPTVAYGWQYWPNAVDFRAIAVDRVAADRVAADRVAADRTSDLWLATLSGLVRYQPDLRQWAVWTTADGLIDNTGESVAVWRDAVWIGTQGGISRYDPQAGTWQSYTLEHGLPGLHNIQLYVDEQADTLWAGTSSGLARYKPGSDRWQTERSDPVRHLWADASALWASVPPSTERRGGLYRLNKSTNHWQDIHQLPDSPPPDTYALTGNEHTLWAVGARGGVYAYDLAAATWREMTELYNRVDTLFQYPTYHGGELWLFGSGRVVRVNVETGQIGRTPYPEQPYFYPQHPPVWIDQSAWVPAQSGLYALEGRQWVKHERSASPAQIDSIAGVYGDRLFLNASGGPGLFEPRSGDWLAIQFPIDSPSTAWSAARRPPAADLWMFGAQAGTLAYYEDATHPLEQIQVPEQIEPQQLLPQIGQDGQLWFAGMNALVAFDPQTRDWRTFSVPNATRIDAVQQGLRSDANDPAFIWLIKDGSALARFDTNIHTYNVYPVPFGVRWHHLAVTEHTVWLGGESSQLLAFDIGQQRWQQMQLDRTCVGSTISALAANEQAVWIGGDQGVVQLGQQTCLTVAEGMLDNQVDRIVLTGDGWAWFVNGWRGLWGYGPIEEETK